MTSTTEITTVSIVSEQTDQAALEPIATELNHAETIQTVIASMDADNTAIVNQTNDTWKFTYGTVEVIVNLTGESSNDTFTVVSTVLPAPFKDEAKMMRYLLEQNASATFESRFAIQNDQVIVIASRSVEDLSAKEISRIITIVAAIADDSDELLKEQFAA